MIVKESNAVKKKAGIMIIKEYRFDPKYSGALIEINGKHGKIKCTGEDRIYFVIEGKGKFMINDNTAEVTKNDLIFISKNTPYDITGNLKLFLLCSPEFKAEHDLSLE